MLNFENFLAFAKQQTGKVNIFSPDHCAIAQFLRANGQEAYVGGFSYKLITPEGLFEEYLPKEIFIPLNKLMNETCFPNWSEVVAALEASHVA